MPTRATYVAATLNGHAMTRILSARCTYSWKRSFPDATIFVPKAPQNSDVWTATTAFGVGAFVTPTTRNGHTYVASVGGTSGSSEPSWPTSNDATVTDGSATWQESGVDIVYDDVITLTMGAGNNVLRFGGLFRQFNYTLYPRAVGLACFGYLTRAHEYENLDGTPQYGGLDLFTLTGSATPSDADVVKAVLTAASITYTGANIGGTGVTWGSRGGTNNPHSYVYVWRAGNMPGANAVLNGFGGVGQTALDYIQEWDKVSAVFVDNVHPAGFYRTYETVNGVYRGLIGGRPRSTPDLTFNEGIDIEPGAEATRSYPEANAAYVTGADFGLSGANPVRNVNGSTFVGQSSNPFQPSTRPVTTTFASAFIEWALEADLGIGMNCERVGNALLQDLNRETVTAHFRTPRDDLITPGMTILVEGPGGQPDRLGMGEPLWVDEVTTGVDENAMFYQDVQGTGGGLPDAYTPAPPG